MQKKTQKSYPDLSEYFPNSELAYRETNLKECFLPLEEHNAISLYATLQQEQASLGLTSEIMHLFHGMIRCRENADSYYRKNQLRQAESYHKTAQTLEIELRLKLYDNFPPQKNS